MLFVIAYKDMSPSQTIKQHKILTNAHHDYEKGMNVHAFFKVHDRDTSEDLVQETFLKTWVYLAKGGRIDLMKAFLYHVLNNLVIDEYRKGKTVSLDVLIEKGYEPTTGFSSRLFDILDGETAVLLIAQLPERYKKVVHMRYVEDLSLAEIAKSTGQTKNAIAVQVHRGLEKLKLLYEPALQ